LEANKKKFSFIRVECKKISSHPRRYLLERMLKLSDAGVNRDAAAIAETALQGALVLAKSGRLKLEDNILRIL